MDTTTTDTETTRDSDTTTTTTNGDTTATATSTTSTEASKEAVDEVKAWLSDIELVDYGDKPVDIAKLASADIIAVS